MHILECTSSYIDLNLTEICKFVSGCTVDDLIVSFLEVAWRCAGDKQSMVRCRLGTKPLVEPTSDLIWCHMAPLS